MSRHYTRQDLARTFGATDVVTERGDEGAAAVKDLTGGIGADRVVKCVGTDQALQQALHSARPGGGIADVPHGVTIDGRAMFYSHAAVQGGRVHPGKVFDLTLPLDQAAEGYKAMDERRAIKTLLRP
ncbi:zinc-binding dehydrogenase [Actinomadura rugatobispora]|uniref:Zinc-binding dehydrogenase n=1 Tax=Actinomadura rugatobispora TaxID=1994 RepID=A0ABW0ZTT6_9ACTN